MCEIAHACDEVVTYVETVARIIFQKRLVPYVAMHAPTPVYSRAHSDNAVTYGRSFCRVILYHRYRAFQSRAYASALTILVEKLDFHVCVTHAIVRMPYGPPVSVG